MAQEGNTSLPRSWSSVASYNLSQRNKTNTLEVRLETEEGILCSLNNEEIERLLRRLKLASSDFTSVQACPERKNVVYITLSSNINVSRFTENHSESFILKEGIRTTTLKHACKKDVSVQIFGLHPDTRDETVIKYLNAHGKVDPKVPVIYSVYPGTPGSSLLAGKRNGNRIYTMEVRKNIGNVHIIDGERVSIRYNGQRRTCNRCHEESVKCPGKALAKNCTAPRIPLSEYMLRYWQSINFSPDNTDFGDDVEESEKELGENVVTADKTSKTYPKIPKESEFSCKYGGVVIKGLKKDAQIDVILEVFKKAGLPKSFSAEDLKLVEKGNNLSIFIYNLQPKRCIKLVNNLNGKVVLDHTLKIFALVDETPEKIGKPESVINTASPEVALSQAQIGTIASNLSAEIPAPLTPISSTTPKDGPSNSSNDTTAKTPNSKFWNLNLSSSSTDSESSDDELDKFRENLKRKAIESPENTMIAAFEKVLSKKQKKKLKNSLSQPK